MAIEDACWECGKWFVKEGKNFNQKYCCKECSEIADQRKRAEYNARYREKYRQKKYGKPQVNTGLSMNDMLDLMDKLSKERGRIVQYGEVQQEILTGKLNVKGGKNNG